MEKRYKTIVRYKLYEKVSNFFFNFHKNNNINDEKFISMYQRMGKLFHFSSLLLKKPEELFISGEYKRGYFYTEEFIGLFLEEVEDFEGLLSFIKGELYVTHKYSNSFINIYTSLISIIVSIQNKELDILEEQEDYNNDTFRAKHLNYYSSFYLSYKKEKNTFLSYAYLDKGLTIGLFIHFKENGGYLFVDWMHNKKKPDSEIKRIINDAISNTEQFLFLRSPNSEIRNRKDGFIRPWCAYEIGHFSALKNKNKMYYISTNNLKANISPILYGFKEMDYINDGFIYPPK